MAARPKAVCCLAAGNRNRCKPIRARTISPASPHPLNPIGRSWTPSRNNSSAFSPKAAALKKPASVADGPPSPRTGALLSAEVLAFRALSWPAAATLTESRIRRNWTAACGVDVREETLRLRQKPEPGSFYREQLELERSATARRPMFTKRTMGFNRRRFLTAKSYFPIPSNDAISPCRSQNSGTLQPQSR